MDSNFYFKDVHSEWIKAIKNSGDSKIVILSPYLTPRLAFTVIESGFHKNCRVYTRFSLQDFVSGSSSIEVLRVLIKKGYKIYEISNLHAKVVIVSGKFASIGSQNITENGKNNIESTFFTHDPKSITKIERLCRSCVKGARIIDIKMIDEIESILPALKEEFDLLNSKYDVIENGVREKIQNAKEKIKAKINLKKTCREALLKIESLIPEDRVPLEMACNFIRASAFSYFNRKRILKPAPGFTRQIFGENFQWKLERGGNTFLISKAILQCKRILVEYINLAVNGFSVDPENLIENLRENIQRSVLNHKGVEYQGRYPVDEINTNDMMFGTSSIDIKLFIRESLNWLPFQLFMEASKANNKF